MLFKTDYISIWKYFQVLYFICTAARCYSYFSLSLFDLIFSVYSKIKDTRSRKQMRRQKRRKKKRSNRQTTTIFIFIKKWPKTKYFVFVWSVRMRALRGKKWWSKTVVFMSINAIINYLITNLSFSRTEIGIVCLEMDAIFGIFQWLSSLSYAHTRTHSK